MRNQGAMLGDASVREGYVQGAMARGFEEAGKNPGGATGAFMGVGMAMNAGGNMFAAASQANHAQMERDAAARAEADAKAAAGWTCECGQKNDGKFCAACGKPKPVAADGWTCECGHVNTGRFCSECGKPKPAGEWKCSCGAVNTGKFCSECGKPRT